MIQQNSRTLQNQNCLITYQLFDNHFTRIANKPGHLDYNIILIYDNYYMAYLT